MAIGLDEKIDWFRVIVELCSYHGYTHQTIAAAVDTPKSTIIGWKSGSHPRYEDGERLIELWVQATKNSRETVPRVKRY